MASISLEKRAEKVSICLTKKNAGPSITVDVAFAVDVSGSMRGMYSSGVVEETIDRIYAMAYTMDPDKSLEVFAFDDGVYDLPTMTDSDYGSYISNHVRKLVGGGTAYSPVLSSVAKKFSSATKTTTVKSIVESAKKGILGLFGVKEKKEVVNTIAVPNDSKVKPLYLIFLTDGESNDAHETRQVVNSMGGGNVYIQFVGIGSSRFGLLRNLADEYDHVGFAEMKNLSVSDEEMFNLFITDELVSFISKFK